MTQKCVHKGCGKPFSDSKEPCTYHPGPPIFHEGQKGWKCCKPRVLTFDEFLSIQPCTTGTHSAVDDTPAPAPKPSDEDLDAQIAARQQQQQSQKQKSSNDDNNNGNENLPPAVERVPLATPPPQGPISSPSPAPPTPKDEEDDGDDDPDVKVPHDAGCKRRGCGARYDATGQGTERGEEECVHHPGHPIFHEGSKGWTCCKRRVLEFDEFMKIRGCETKSRHLFVGNKKRRKTNGEGIAGGANDAEEGEEEALKEVRNDFYQTSTSVIASLYLKKIDKERSTVHFVEDGGAVLLDLHTGDHKRYKVEMRLWAPIKSDQSSFRIMGTKLELTLAKAQATGWPVLRKEDPHTGEIIQAGRAGRV